MNLDSSAASSDSALLRTIGRWTLAGLVVNAIVGSSIFGLPAVIAGKLGGAGTWAWVWAAVAIGVIVACFAEVASRFDGAGGPYRYAHDAFGPLAGICIGWLSYLVRITASASNANLFVIALGLLWPGAAGPVASKVVLAALIFPLAAVNYRGVRGGARLSSVLVVTKALPVLLFVIAGLVFISRNGALATASVPVTAGTWLDSVLLLGFAYGGFEAALVPMAEARDPRRDAPFALSTALSSIAVLYALTQFVVLAVLPDPSASPRPLAEAARVMAGTPGAAFMTVAALFSIAGYIAGTMVNVPRITWAMAEQGDLPAWFGRVHPRFRTPTTSLMVYAALAWTLAASGSFLQNLSLSAASRLFVYGAVCAALPVFRAREALGDTAVRTAVFRLPAGSLVAMLGLGVALLLATRMGLREVIVTAATLALGGVNWWWVARGHRTARA
ncbi:MAG TPA: APC family permease [Gemmatimonadales bacterium]|nr:APC family permease [Gemmatimonadales bacterium]